MLKYFIIGLIIQIVISVTRCMRKVADAKVLLDPRGLLIYLGMVVFNVIVWPISIICEIINIKRGE